MRNPNPCPPNASGMARGAGSAFVVDSLAPYNAAAPYTPAAARLAGALRRWPATHALPSNRGFARGGAQ